jgi:hypothetical protein
MECNGRTRYGAKGGMIWRTTWAKYSYESHVHMDNNINHTNKRTISHLNRHAARRKKKESKLFSLSQSCLPLLLSHVYPIGSKTVINKSKEVRTF